MVSKLALTFVGDTPSRFASKLCLLLIGMGAGPACCPFRKLPLLRLRSMGPMLLACRDRLRGETARLPVLWNDERREPLPACKSDAPMSDHLVQTLKLIVTPQ